MDARFELRDWVEKHRPDLLGALSEPPELGLPKLNEASGLWLTVDHLYKYGPDHVCEMYLAALKLMVEVVDASTPPAAPSKPPPALPVEAWHSKAFDAEQAHAATLALCRGQ